jgi:membrane-associated protein
MNLTDFFSQGLTLIGPFNFKVIVFLFLLCLIGEAANVFVPYLFETTWLLIGFQFSQRVLSPGYLVLLLLTCIAGRETGVLVLYYISRSGSTLFTKYRDHFIPRMAINNTFPIKLFRKMDILASPFSVALGRLLWLRIPLTLILGAKRKLKVLLLGVALSSLVYEGIYVTLGAIVGTTTRLEPVRLILYFLAGLTVIYVVTFAIRRLIGRLARHRRLEASRRSNKSNLP